MGVMESNEGGGRVELRDRGGQELRCDCETSGLQRTLLPQRGRGGNNRSERKFVITERSTLHSRREARENSYFISLPRLLLQLAAESPLERT